MERKKLEELGLTKEQVDAVCDMHHEEMTPVKEKLKKAEDDLKLADDKVSETEGKLRELEGLDKEGYEQKIKELQEDLKKKGETHAAELADRDFNDLLKESISEAKGRNTRAIAALLDVDTLKTSRNQKEDVSAAIRKLMEAEDSKMLFGEPEPQKVGTGNLIGTVTKAADVTDDAAIRAAMGLPPVPENTQK